MDLKQGDLENIILNALWDLEQDGLDKIFVGDVQERIRSVDKGWAYTTVKTVLDRLVDKAIASREKEGKKYLYRSLIKRNEAGRLAMQKVLRQFFKNDIDSAMSSLQQIQSHPDLLAALQQAKQPAGKPPAEPGHNPNTAVVWYGADGQRNGRVLTH